MINVIILKDTTLTKITAAMTDNFATIKDAFIKAGIDIPKAEYSITEYSLNTDLSFKFNNADEFIDFLNFNSTEDTSYIERINKVLVEAGIRPDKFFYVNFYKSKVAEL
jgi:hypothetical protein